MSRWAGLVLTLALLMAPTACSGEKKVSAQTWAKDICGTVRPWAQSIQTSVASTKNSTAAKSDPVAAKAQLERVFGDAAKATDKAIEGVDKAGRPDVKNGGKIAKELRAALVAARSAFLKAQKAVGNVVTSDKAAFDARIGQIGAQLGKDYQAAGKKISVTQSAELKKVFDKTPECTA
ncbi:MAG: hypothetical protein ABJA34_07145 [Pseudonocardiales bacterium]